MNINDDIWILDESAVTTIEPNIPMKPEEGLVEQVVKEEVPQPKQDIFTEPQYGDTRENNDVNFSLDQEQGRSMDESMSHEREFSDGRRTEKENERNADKHNDISSDRRILRLVGPETIFVDKVPFILGKSRSCDYSIPDQVVSRRHAKIFYEDGEYYIKDLGSTNNTYIDGKPIHVECLCDGQILELANRKFKVVL